MSGGQLMAVLIVAIVMVASILKARYNGNRPKWGDPRTDHANAADAADAARLRDEVRTLKERIAVLERIATDRTSHLDHEIERLRDR